MQAGRGFVACMLVLALVTPVQAGALKWEKKLDSDVRMKLVHDTGIIIVGTKKTLYGFDPKTGAEKWKVEKLLKGYDVSAIRPIPGSSYLIYPFKKGMMKPVKTICIDVTTGKKMWELGGNTDSARLRRWMAAYLGKKIKDKDRAWAGVGVVSFVVPDYERNQFLLGGVITGVVGYKPKTFNWGVSAVDIDTGELKYLYALPPKDKATYPFNAPIIAGDLVVLDWGGIHSFKITDGTPVASVPFKRKALQGANGTTVIDGIAYVASGGILRAVDIRTGAIKWETGKLKNVFPELAVVGDKLIARTGGTFTENKLAGRPGAALVSKKGKTKTFKPMGIAVFDKNSGAPAFDFNKFNKDKKRRISAMTAMAVDGGTVYFATANSFRAFDVDALDYRYQVSLGEIDKQDAPKSTLLQDGKAYVLMSQSTKAFNPADGSLVWSKTFEPPKVSKWAKFAMAAVNAAAAANAQAKANATHSTVKYKTGSLAGIRYQAAVASGLYNYVLTNEHKKPTIIGVSLKTGKDDRRAVVDNKQPDYIVDEIGGILVNIKKKKTLQLFDLKN